MSLQHRCFPVNFVKFLSAPFLTEHLRWLLLKGQSNFQAKCLKRRRKRDLKSTAADKNSITISYINAIEVAEAILSMFQISADASLDYPADVF